MADSDNKDDTPTYVNFAKFDHSEHEFFVDFATLYPPMNARPIERGKANGTVAGRFVMSPPHAKRMLEVLAVNVKKYETKYGDIKSPPPPKTDILLN